MKALTTIIAAGFVFANAASVAIAGDSQVGAADSQVGASSAGVTVAAAPAAAAVRSVTISKTRSRAEVHAEAVEAVKNHKTALAVQLEQYQ